MEGVLATAAPGVDVPAHPHRRAEVAPARSVRGVRDAADDDVLVARLVAGDDSALAAAYDRYGGFVFALARRVTGSEATARDVTQEVFTLLWQGPQRVDFTRGTLRTWLGVVAHRRAANEVRAAARRRARDTRAANGLTNAGDDAQADVIESEAGRWRAALVRSLVVALPDEQRQALQLAYFDGCTYRDVARQLGIPEGTAKSRLRLALARLRTMIDAEPLEAWL
jgi:RNA polymerase sigma-70 factor (ECF subfamily)